MKRMLGALILLSVCGTVRALNVSEAQSSLAQINRAFQMPLIKPFSAPASLQNEPAQASKAIYVAEIALKDLLNKHYQLGLSATFGKNKVVYSVSGQEEKKEGLALFGAMTLLLTAAGEQTPLLIELDSRAAPKQMKLGGTDYLVTYERAIRIEKGKIHFNAVDRSDSQTILFADILKGVYASSKPLQNARQQAPLRVALFTKLSSLKDPATANEFWIMFVKDGLDKKEEGADSLQDAMDAAVRTHIGSEELPVNNWPLGPADKWFQKTITLDGYKIVMALVDKKIKNAKGDIEVERRLYLEVSK